MNGHGVAGLHGQHGFGAALLFRAQFLHPIRVAASQAVRPDSGEAQGVQAAVGQLQEGAHIADDGQVNGTVAARFLASHVHLDQRGIFVVGGSEKVVETDAVAQNQGQIRFRIGLAGGQRTVRTGQTETERVQIRNQAASHIAGENRDAALFHKLPQGSARPGIPGSAARYQNGPFSLAQQGDGFFHSARVHGPGIQHGLVPGALPTRHGLAQHVAGQFQKDRAGPPGQGHAKGRFHVFGHPLGLGADIGGLDDRRGNGRLGGVLKVHLVPVVRA